MTYSLTCNCYAGLGDETPIDRVVLDVRAQEIKSAFDIATKILAATFGTHPDNVHITGCARTTSEIGSDAVCAYSMLDKIQVGQRLEIPAEKTKKGRTRSSKQ